MKKIVTFGFGLLLLLTGCNINELDFKDIQKPPIRSIVALPLGEFTYTLRELIDEIGDSTLVIEEDPETTLLSLVYTDNFSYTSTSDLISIPNISGTGTVAIPSVATPAPVNSTLSITPTTFSLFYSATNGERITQVNHDTGDLVVTVSSGIASQIDFSLIMPNSVNAANAPISFSGSVTNTAPFTAIKSLQGYISSFAQSGTNNSYDVVFSGTINILQGQTIAPGQQVTITVAFQNQTFQVIYGYFGQDTVQISNQMMNFGFFDQLGGNASIEFQNPQINLTFQNEIGIPLGVNYGGIYGMKTNDTTGLIDYTYLGGAITSAFQVINAPGMDQVGQSVVTQHSINGGNSTLNKVLGNNPESIGLSITGVSNPGGAGTENFFVPGGSTITADLEVRIPMAMKLINLERSQDFDLGGGVKLDVVDSVVMRVVTVNLLPFSTYLDLQLLDANDSILHEVLDTKVMATPFLNIKYIANEPEVNVADIPLSSAGILALNSASKVRLAMRLRTPETLNSQEIYPKFLARYYLTVKLSVLGRLDLQQ
ncbi:MAG: lipoprotein [Cyclobacteriaceae bacterium]|nr:lipoprotein [Cyclobacteriaceae bacterium]